MLHSLVAHKGPADIIIQCAAQLATVQFLLISFGWEALLGAWFFAVLCIGFYSFGFRF